MKLPAIQFYPGDWRRDPGVQALDYETRGIWFEILCLMHESDSRGVLLLNGKPMPDDALANLLRLDNQKLTLALSKIEAYGVASRRQEDGALINRRMIRDENIRKLRAEAGKQGGNPILLKQNPTTGVKQNPTPSSSSSTSVSKPPASPEGLEFADWFLSLTDATLRLVPTWREQWAKVYDALIRLDKREPAEIRRVCEWARKDTFWSKNFLTPMKLRARDNSGLRYFDVFKAKCGVVAPPPEASRTGDHPQWRTFLDSLGRKYEPQQFAMEYLRDDFAAWKKLQPT